MPAPSPSSTLREAITWLYDAIAKEQGYQPEFEHLRSALGQGKAWAGVGHASGQKRAADAAQLALLSFEGNLRDCAYFRADILADENITMQEYSEAAKLLADTVKAQGGPDIRLNMTIDASLGNEMRVILLASENGME